ncbi:cupin-like domain-containing protein [Marilutibacter spongiae]|uniref:Cupin-like domain-containing protein n=1 Tax=Marilutibacter spongiae TaxID=2025720 RepID=A0A7W3TNW0_9GAMM|nr:cupin-like domain-containing protein [Lysobacter spongiae]
MRVFSELEEVQAKASLDRRAFVFGHTLEAHPALSLRNLSEVIPALPREQVFHSSGRLDMADDFDNAHKEHRPGQGLEAALDDLRGSDAYIMVRQPEAHPSFRPVYDALCSDVEGMAAAAGIRADFDDAMLYLFIASPDSVTPFHIDRYSTCLMQVRGCKEVVVYPPWDPRVVADEDAEHYFARSGRRPEWREGAAALGERFQFTPGQALHIPFAAGHHVRNGSEDVSISLSIIFRTSESRRLTQALLFNHYARRYLSRLGMNPRRVAMDAAGVAAKSALWRVGRRAAGLLKAPVAP